MKSALSLALIVEAGMRRLLRLIAAVAVVSAACGGSSPSAPTPPTPTPSAGDLTGTFSGNVSDSIGPGIWNCRLTQSGANVSGTMTGGGPVGTVRGDFSGTLSGTTLTFTIVVPQGGLQGAPTCAQNITGAATGVTATRISGTYSGTTTCTGGFNPGPLNNGQFTLTKQ